MVALRFILVLFSSFLPSIFVLSFVLCTSRPSVSRGLLAPLAEGVRNLLSSAWLAETSHLDLCINKYRLV